MRAVRKTSEEQYRLVVECRQSGLTDCDWCRENGINFLSIFSEVKEFLTARQVAEYYGLKAKVVKSNNFITGKMGRECLKAMKSSKKDMSEHKCRYLVRFFVFS